MAHIGRIILTVSGCEMLTNAVIPQEATLKLQGVQDHILLRLLARRPLSRSGHTLVVISDFKQVASNPQVLGASDHALPVCGDSVL